MANRALHLAAAAWAGVVLLGGCASQPAAPGASGAVEAERASLSCLLPSNCVNSLSGGPLLPLRYVGPPENARAAVLATLAGFPEARLERNEPLMIDAIFTTPVGFRDRVEFRIDPQGQRIDYRSRSLFGLFDFGKNSSRMQEFLKRFEQQAH